MSPRNCVIEQKSECEPVITPAVSYYLDSRPYGGVWTYLEHPAPGVSLDSWPMEGVVIKPRSQGWEDSCEVNMILPESLAPTIDSNVSMKNLGDGVCRPLIYASDVSQDALETNSPYPEVVNIQNAEEEIYTGRAVTRTKRWLDMDDNSDTDSVAELEYKTWDEACVWEFRNARGNTNMDLFQSSLMEMNREYVSDVDTDTDSDAELEYKARKYALQTWKCHSAPADFPRADVPPGFIQNPTSDMTRSNMDNDENPEKCGLIKTYILRGFVLTTSMGGKQ